MDSRTDLELLACMKDGLADARERAFQVLFERHQRRAFEVAYRVLRNRALASEAVQEAFLRVHRKGADFEARSQFSSWFHRVVVNQAIDLQRRERRHRAASFLAGDREDDDAPGVPEPTDEHSMGPIGAAQEAERARLVRAAMERLSPKLAEVVKLRYPRGLSYEEIGDLLDVPPGTVKSRLNRAHAALRGLLSDLLEEGHGD